MSPREELDLILKLIRKYNLPISPILEYAVNEKKEEYPEEDTKPIIIECEDDTVFGISYKQEFNADEDKVATFITSKQLEDLNHIEEFVHKPLNNLSVSLKGIKTYQDIASDYKDKQRLEAVLAALEHFDAPATPRDVARTISRSAWGGNVKENSVDTMLKRLPEVECVPCGKYILKTKNKSLPIDDCQNNQESVFSGHSVSESVCCHNPVSLKGTDSQIIKDKVPVEQYRLVSPVSESTDITLELIQKMVDWDKQHRVLDDWKLNFMQDVVSGKKEFSGRMKYAFYLFFQTLKNKGFSN